jgi:hypothetical protein
LDKRTLEQNRLMWAMLRDVSKQVTYYGLKYSDDDWKQIFSAVISKQRMAPSINGDGVVMLGVSTRKQTKEWFQEMIMLIEVFGAENGVKFSAPDYYEDLAVG